MNSPPTKPTRKDALSNRERILAVAREALAASGSASLTAIARKADVGIGTLYRHFPTRESLILELYRHDIQQLIDLAPAMLESCPPLVALRRWFGEVARYGQLKYGVAEVIHAATNGGLDDEYYEPFVGAIAVLLDAGIADGSLKPGLDPEDVLLQLGVLWRIDPGRGGEARAARILDLIIDGLRARPTARSSLLSLSEPVWWYWRTGRNCIHRTPLDRSVGSGRVARVVRGRGCVGYVGAVALGVS